MKRAVMVVVMLVTACGSVGPVGGQPGQPDGPTSPGSDAPGGGSGSGSDPLADYRSGTRIKMQVLTTPDGAKQFNGWFDTQRDEACQFVTASDGVTRCLPTWTTLVLDGTNGPYVDAACTQPAEELLASAVCSPVKYIHVFQSGTCPSFAPRVYPAKQISSMFVKSNTACTSTPIPAGIVVYGVAGPEIPPSSFQSATLAVE